MTYNQKTKRVLLALCSLMALAFMILLVVNNKTTWQEQADKFCNWYDTYKTPVTSGDEFCDAYIYNQDQLAMFVGSYCSGNDLMSDWVIVYHLDNPKLNDYQCEDIKTESITNEKMSEEYLRNKFNEIK
jgi:hypothetical protein